VEVEDVVVGENFSQQAAIGEAFWVRISPNQFGFFGIFDGCRSLSELLHGLLSGVTNPS
jgi:hypothetical protein